VFLATSSADDSSTPDVMRLALRSADSGGEGQLNVSPNLVSGVEKHLAVVVNGQNGGLALYVDGTLADSGTSNALQGQLSTLTDNNNWLGRSQFSADAGFEGSLLEFRIYDRALNAQQIGLSFDLGPDAPVSP
ncbi:MAG TPA: LamG domain-containing protein, partial [Polyangiaceae bacterium]|nr:LamG domain-containing protein [Polyangiaceae bacterium]